MGPYTKMTSRKEVDKNLNFGYLDLLQITRFVLGTTELPSLHGIYGIGWSSSAAVVQQSTARANTRENSTAYALRASALDSDGVPRSTLGSRALSQG